MARGGLEPGILAVPPLPADRDPGERPRSDRPGDPGRRLRAADHLRPDRLPPPRPRRTGLNLRTPARRPRPLMH